MKKFKMIGLMLAILFCKYTHIISSGTLSQESAKTQEVVNGLIEKLPPTDQQQADRLIEQAYVTPEMQWTILQFCEYPYAFDLNTRMPVLYTQQGQPVKDSQARYQSMPTVNEILSKAKEKTPSYTTLQALETTLEAINIALYVAAVEASYDPKRQNYYFYQSADGNIIKYLKDYKQQVDNKIDSFRHIKLSTDNKPSNSTYPTSANLASNHQMIKADSIATFLENNDYNNQYKTQQTYTEANNAANLLIKQSFIAHIQHFENSPLMEYLSYHIKLNPDIRLLYASFPDFNALIEIAKKAPKKTLQNQMFKHIRQSVLTALFIANRNSNYFITSDPLLVELKIMDATIKGWCNNKEYGATAEDLARDSMWTNLTNIAIGASVVAAAGVAAWAYNNPKNANAAYNEYVKQPLQYVKNQIIPEQNLIEKAKTSLNSAVKSAQAKIATIAQPEESTNESFVPNYTPGSGAKKAVENLSEHAYKNDTIERDKTILEYINSLIPQNNNKIERDKTIIEHINSLIPQNTDQSQPLYDWKTEDFL